MTREHRFARTSGILLIMLDSEITFAVVIATSEGDEPDQRPFVDYTNYEGKKMRKEDREPVSDRPSLRASRRPDLTFSAATFYARRTLTVGPSD